MRTTLCCECSKKTVLCSVSSPPTTSGLSLSQQLFFRIILVEMPGEADLDIQVFF